MFTMNVDNERIMKMSETSCISCSAFLHAWLIVRHSENDNVRTKRLHNESIESEQTKSENYR